MIIFLRFFVFRWQVAVSGFRNIGGSAHSSFSYPENSAASFPDPRLGCSSFCKGHRQTGRGFRSSIAGYYISVFRLGVSLLPAPWLFAFKS